MAVKIKLARIGKIREPHYRIIVSDARTRRNGRAIETVGQYHPKDEPSRIELDSERVQYWLSVGAQPTEPVESILKVTGDWQKFKGLPGAEGRMKVAEPKPSKQELFAAALAAAGEESTTEATTPKKKGGKKAADKAESDDKAEKTEKTEKSEDKAEKADDKAEKSEGGEA